MHITLNRAPSGDKATIGGLYIDGDFECNTLEDVVRDVKIPGATAIPSGTYQLVIDHSDRFGCDMPHILNVPNFGGIRIHAGNTDADTEGCILLGVSTGDPDFVTMSRLTFNKFYSKLMNRLNGGEQVSITVTDASV